jgi:hypothetical protein
MEQLLAIRVSVPQARSWADRCLARAVAPLPSGGRKDAPQGPNKKQKDEAKTIGEPRRIREFESFGLCLSG